MHLYVSVACHLYLLSQEPVKLFINLQEALYGFIYISFMCVCVALWVLEVSICVEI